MSRTSDASTSVLLGHRHALLREGIACILRDSGFRVIGQADSSGVLHQLLSHLAPDVILLDWDLPDGGAEAIKALVADCPQGIVVILTRPQPPETFLAAMQAGAGGYLSVNLSPEEFTASLRILAKGDLVVSREMVADLKEELAARDNNETKDDLSDREREVLGLVSRGATNREIAESLTITENTVKAHLRRILEKLDLRNRQQAAAYAVREGLVIENDILIESSESSP